MSENESSIQEAPTPVETSDLQYLEPRKLRFFRHGAALRLTVEDESSYLKVTVARAFPLSHPQRYFSVRFGDNKEVGVLVDVAELDEESRRLVAEELERRYLVPVIRRVIRIKERFGTVEWEVDTDRGVYRFTTRNMREKVVQPSPGRYLLTDVDENRYDVRDLAALDAASQAWLMRHL
jgi:Domain of unknown function (DUF1854)